MFSLAYYFEACKCSLCQAHASGRKHQKVSSTKVFGSVRQKIVILPLLHKNFPYQMFSGAQKRSQQNFSALGSKKTSETNRDTPVPQSSSIPETFRNTKRTNSRKISLRQSFRHTFKILPTLYCSPKSSHPKHE